MLEALDEVGAKRLRAIEQLDPDLDADDPVAGGGSDSDSDSDSDGEDDEAELMAELAKIKQERLAEAAERDEARRAEEEQTRADAFMSGNPLLTGGSGASTDFTVSRRWDDDVVFKNCARGEEKKAGDGYINDTLRSEFHRRFMSKYVR